MGITKPATVSAQDPGELRALHALGRGAVATCGDLACASAAGWKNAKKRAVVAVARKLAILLHRLWISGGCMTAPQQPRWPARRGRSTEMEMGKETLLDWWT